MKVLILGGYGTFGGRLARLLGDEERLTLIVAGRSMERAEAFCAALPARATLTPAAFDRDGDVAAQLSAHSPDIIVDASGPFQAYNDSYRLVRAIISRGNDCLDLADGSEFVKRIVQFDAQARECGRPIGAGWFRACDCASHAYVPSTLHHPSSWTLEGDHSRHALTI